MVFQDKEERRKTGWETATGIDNFEVKRTSRLSEAVYYRMLWRRTDYRTATRNDTSGDFWNKLENDKADYDIIHPDNEEMLYYMDWVCSYCL